MKPILIKWIWQDIELWEFVMPDNLHHEWLVIANELGYCSIDMITKKV